MLFMLFVMRFLDFQGFQGCWPMGIPTISRRFPGVPTNCRRCSDGFPMISREVYGTSGRQVEHFWFWGTSEDFPSEFWEGCERFPSGAWVLPGVRVKKRSLPVWRLPKGGTVCFRCIPERNALWGPCIDYCACAVIVCIRNEGARNSGTWATVGRQVGDGGAASGLERLSCRFRVGD